MCVKLILVNVFNTVIRLEDFKGYEFSNLEEKKSRNKKSKVFWTLKVILPKKAELGSGQSFLINQSGNTESALQRIQYILAAMFLCPLVFVLCC